MKLAIELPQEAIAEFCRKWHIVQLSVFGSILRDDFREDSDVDFLAEFAPDGRPSMRDLWAMEEELAMLIQRPVDLVETNVIRASENWIRRKAILDSAEPIYHAA